MSLHWFSARRGAGPHLRLTALLGVLLAGGLIIPATAADAPWRLGEALELPSWLAVSGEHRVRYETLAGQFRAGYTGGDQALALRTSLVAELRTEPVQLVTEILDARQYLSDAGSPLDTTMVDALDVLQAHVRWRAGDLIPGGTNTVRVGRMTLDLGNRRLVARNAFRNTINSGTGADWLWEADRGASVRAFYVLPVIRRPDDFDSLLDNDIAADWQDFDQQFGGLYATLPRLPADIRTEVYWLQLYEGDEPYSRRRRLSTPGARILRPAKVGTWDFEVEGAYQFGTSRRRAGAAELTLDHEAHLLVAGGGYTFELPWKPRVGLRYQEATGDRDPTDRENQRFDVLFGARRFEFGPTGIYGMIARSNLRSPDYHLNLRPHARVECLLAHRLVWLESSRDAWVSANVRDPRGNSGSFVGHQLESRLRWDLLPGNVRLDTGVAWFLPGEFLNHAPNATRQGDTVYTYFEVSLFF